MYEILEIDLHNGPTDLNQKNYNEHIRPLLFDIFHLLDDEIAKEVNYIEDIFERQFVMEEEDPSDGEDLSNSYLKIINLIKEQFKELRESKKGLRNK